MQLLWLLGRVGPPRYRLGWAAGSTSGAWSFGSLSTCRAVMVTYGVKIAVRLVRRDCGRVLSRLYR